MDENDARARYDDICDALTAWRPDVRRSSVFGMPCLKRSDRVVAGFTRPEGAMVFKLTDPATHARALAIPGAHLFDPSGRGEHFRQWVVIPYVRADEWEDLAYEAVNQDHFLKPAG